LPSEYQATGLAKLSAKELDALQSILDGKSPPTEKAATVASEPESSPAWQPSNNAERRAIETEVLPEFAGLFGKTVIRFANGQLWQQTDGAVFSRRLKNKRVRIKPGMINSWRVQFEESNQSFTIKRIE
jgi:hypothetical protein